jgi:hypothetical protein
VAEDDTADGGSGDEPAATLTRWLVTRGYKVQSDEYWPESFGNRLVTFVRRNVRVELNKDRSEWLIGVGSTLTPKAGMYEPTLWRLVLEKVAATEAQPPFADEATVLRAVLPAIEGALSTGWTGWQALLRARSERLTRVLVKPPPQQALLDAALLIPSTGHPEIQRAAMARVARAQHAKRRHLQG